MDVSTLIPSIRNAEHSMRTCLGHFSRTRHMILYYEDVIRDKMLVITKKRRRNSLHHLTSSKIILYHSIAIARDVYTQAQSEWTAKGAPSCLSERQNTIGLVKLLADFPVFPFKSHRTRSTHFNFQESWNMTKHAGHQAKLKINRCYLGVETYRCRTR
jgi:hypothetical protein